MEALYLSSGLEKPDKLNEIFKSSFKKKRQHADEFGKANFLERRKLANIAREDKERMGKIRTLASKKDYIDNAEKVALSNELNMTNQDARNYLKNIKRDSTPFPMNNMPDIGTDDMKFTLAMNFKPFRTYNGTEFVNYNIVSEFLPYNLYLETLSSIATGLVEYKWGYNPDNSLTSDRTNIVAYAPHAKSADNDVSFAYHVMMTSFKFTVDNSDISPHYSESVLYSGLPIYLMEPRLRASLNESGTLLFNVNGNMVELRIDDPAVEVCVVDPVYIQSNDLDGVCFTLELRHFTEGQLANPYSGTDYYSFYAYMRSPDYYSILQGSRIIKTNGVRRRDLRMIISPQFVLGQRHTSVNKGVNVFDIYTGYVNIRKEKSNLRTSDSFTVVKRKPTIMVSDTLYVYDVQGKNPLVDYSGNFNIMADSINDAVKYIVSEANPARRDQMCSPRVIGSILMCYLQIYELEQVGLGVDDIKLIIGYSGLPSNINVMNFRRFGLKAFMVAQFVKVYSLFTRILSSLFENSTLKLIPTSFDKTKFTKVINSTRDYKQAIQLLRKFSLNNMDNMVNFFKDFVETTLRISYNGTTIQKFVDSIGDDGDGSLNKLIEDTNILCNEIINGHQESRVKLISLLANLYEKGVDVLPLTYEGTLRLSKAMEDSVRELINAYQLRQKIQTAAYYLGYLHVLRQKLATKIDGMRGTIDHLSGRIRDNNTLLDGNDAAIMAQYNLQNVADVANRRQMMINENTVASQDITRLQNELPYYEDLIARYDTLGGMNVALHHFNSFFRNVDQINLARIRQSPLPAPFTLGFKYETSPLLTPADRDKVREAAGSILENTNLVNMPDNYFMENINV